ncbi:MAG: hypothetical protein HYW77_01225 [Parcubacteria group bacterium]|nr:hypothetical protein [Parcubacteria group bacterium]
MRNPLTIKIESWFGVFLLISAMIFVLITTFSAVANFEDEISGLSAQQLERSQ